MGIAAFFTTIISSVSGNRKSPPSNNKEIRMGNGNGHRDQYSERSRDRRSDRRGNNNGFGSMQNAFEDQGFRDTSAPRRSSGPRDNTPPTIVEEGITGAVKFFNESKGFGFIVRDDGKKDLFVHITNLTDRTAPPKDGQKVKFDVGNNSRGDMAMNVVFA